MQTIFTVLPSDLDRVNPQQAVIFFGELLRAEAIRIGIGINKVNVSFSINVADGGIDASIKDVGTSFKSDLIKPGLTCYQIKAGTSFKPWQEAQVKKELFGKKQPTVENLGDSVKNCLDVNGTYVLVCVKQDLVEKNYQKAVKLIKSYFKECGYKNPKVEVWSQNNIIGFLYNRFPSLSLNLNERSGMKFQTHKSWSCDAEMRREFKAGKKQEELIQSIQNELPQNIEAIHLHVWGEPGIGKTRLVLEALRNEELKPLVIYCDSANKFRDSDLMNEILREDNQFCAILVIDECDPDSRSYIWNKLKYIGPRIKLITIYNDFDGTSGNIKYFCTPPLENKQVSSIIQSYGIPGDQAFRWVEFCSGSPRVAHVFGQNLVNNPEDLLKPLDTYNVWERYIVGDDIANETTVRQKKLVLKYIALFKRIGYEKPVDREAREIAKLLELADPQITRIRFQEIVRNLRQRKILQGEYTLYITPKALHIKLWTDWWDTHGVTCDFGELLKGLPESLHEGFFEMLKYAAESKTASRLVKTFLGENSPFVINDYIRKPLAERFLSTLAEADPEATLRCLKKKIGLLNRNELLKFTTGRREVVRALERIAVWRDLFPDAARLLLALGEAENETWSNNASGVFAGLFSNRYGKFSSTEASPKERFPILEEALNSESKERRMIALDACDKTLSTQPVFRIIGAEYQGLRKEAQLWVPKTDGELYEAYRRVWDLLYDSLDSMAEDDRQKAIDILLHHASGLSKYQYLADMVINTLTELSKKNYIDKRNVLVSVLEILGFDGKDMPQKTRQRWEKLRDQLEGHDFSSLLRRFAGLNLLTDQADEEGNVVDKIKPEIEDLARQAVETPELLRPEFRWLTSIEAQNGYRFGYELAKKDNDFSLLSILLEAQRRTGTGEKASVFFLGGYFHFLFEKNREKWQQQLDELAEDRNLNHWIPELVYYSEITDKVALHILGLAEKGIITIDHFKFFKFGRKIKDLSEDIFKKWIIFLLGSSKFNAILTALDFYYFYYVHNESHKNLSVELTMRLLFHPLLFQKNEKVVYVQMDNSLWRNIAETFVKLYPEKSLEIAEIMLKYFREPGTIIDSYPRKTLNVLKYITGQKPVEVWKLIVKYLGPPFDIRALHLSRWLSGEENASSKQKEDDEGILQLIPLELIWEWVDEDIEHRACYFASFVPDKLFKEEGKICLARELLARYGSRQDVRESLMANFSPKIRWGPLSQHYLSKRQKLIDFKKEEDNENVIRWIDEYVSELERRIEEAKIMEEREA